MKRGFTLLEILAALLILALGMAGIVGLLYSSITTGHLAAERSAAAMLLPEAIKQIELEHLITAETRVANPTIPPEVESLFVQTLRNAQQSDKNAPYRQIAVGPVDEWGQRDASKPVRDLAPEPGLQGTNLNEWPRRPDPPRNMGGIPLRLWYQLEQHPDWWPHSADGTPGTENPASIYRGVYILTVVCYRDTEKDMSKPVQVTDPVVTYLRDRKQR